MAELALAQRHRNPCRDENACDVWRRDLMLAIGVARGLSKAGAELVVTTLEVSPDHGSVAAGADRAGGAALADKPRQVAIASADGQDEQVVPVPRRWSDVSPTWMTTSLARRLPGVVVSDIKGDFGFEWGI